MRDGDSPASLYSPSNPLLFSDRWRCCWRPSIRSPRGLQCKAGTWPSSRSPSWRTTTWTKWCNISSSFPSGMEPSRFYWAKGEVGKLQGLLRKPLLPFPLSGAWQQAEDLNLTIALVFAFTETAREYGRRFYHRPIQNNCSISWPSRFTKAPWRNLPPKW